MLTNIIKRLPKNSYLIAFFGLWILPFSLMAQQTVTEPAIQSSNALITDPLLKAKLQAALTGKGTNYKPRTEHLLEDGSPQFINRLILEDSPYLVQHAHNPVNWFSWGKAAFEKAQQENKLIFLSIGYSTCHWCHVMEKESFDNIDIARILNKHFIAIKVDRERRPDVDATYMTAVQLMTKRGGWPLSNFLTPAGQSFYGGTYFKPLQFTGILKALQQIWQDDPDSVKTRAQQITDAVRHVMSNQKKAKAIGRTIIAKTVNKILTRHDEFYGGFGQAPKFPDEPLLFLLLEYTQRYQHQKTLHALETTLQAMAQGGIYDQISGGFHRYSTDSEWLTPHFEKMLYNQAHLARIYLHAYQLTKKPLYARITREILNYVLTFMTTPEGGFYSATDADSEGNEGVFFLWTPEQIKQALSPQQAQLAIAAYGVTKQGNFEHKNILHHPISRAEFAKQHKMDPADLTKQLNHIRQKLNTVREQRIHPIRDNKILTAWNGMMLGALAKAADTLGDEVYLNAAKKAAHFLWQHHHKGEGALWRVYLKGSTSIEASQEDYAYFAEGLIYLFDATGDDIWLEKAEQLTSSMLTQFWDPKNGGFFMSVKKPDVALMVRPKATSDGAIPSGNSVALHVLAMLAKRTGKNIYQDKANATLSAFSGDIQAQSEAYTYLLYGADQLLHGEMADIQYAARGQVSAKAQLDVDQQTLTVNIHLRPGWHINAHHPLQNNLIATTLTLDSKQWSIDTLPYPKHELVKLGFQHSKLAIYQGDIQLQATLKPEAPNTLPWPQQMSAVNLQVQACSEQTCLAPETLKFKLF